MKHTKCTGGQAIGVQHLPYEVRAPRIGVAPMPSAAPTILPMPTAFPSAAPALSAPAPASTGTTKTLSDVEMEYILQVYTKNNLNKQRTADELGISLKTLYNKLNKYEEERQQRAG
jgi:DNA-binding NtrC family response regulator